MSELIDIVDEHNRVVDTVERRVMRARSLPHRSTYVAFRTAAGRYLVEVRTLCKDYAPGLLDACVGGVVCHGESPDEGARREFCEEIGVDPADVDFHDLGCMNVPRRDCDSFFVACMYLACGERITVRQASELSAVMYLTYEEIMALEPCFTGDSIIALREIVTRARARGLL